MREQPALAQPTLDQVHYCPLNCKSERIPRRLLRGDSIGKSHPEGEADYG